jgi:hypothetical protein
MKRRLVVALTMAQLLAGGPGWSAELPAPTGPVLLTVTGRIAATNTDGAALFDRALLASLGEATVRTSTPWTDGVVEFAGVSLAALLEAVGAAGQTGHFTAANDYAVDLDLAELRRYPVLLAMRQDGRELSLRDRGPLWVVYPRDDHPELMRPLNNSKWIWQVRSIDIR